MFKNYVTIIRQLCFFLNIVEIHVQKLCYRYIVILKGFLATSNRHKGLFKCRNVSNWGWSCLNFRVREGCRKKPGKIVPFWPNLRVCSTFFPQVHQLFCSIFVPFRQNYCLWYSRNLFLKKQKWITDLSYMIQKIFQKKYWNFSDRIKNVELYTHFRNCALPPSGPDRAQRQQSKLITPQKFWHTNQDRIKNVELYTHF